MDPTRESSNATLLAALPAVDAPLAVENSAADTIAAQPEIDGSASPEQAAAAEHPPDTLSPAVRRLVREYALDISSVQGTGPSGRIRVGDVIGMLDGRPAPANRPARTARQSAAETDEHSTSARPRAPAGHAATPTSTIFECDLSRVLAHREQQRRSNSELLLTSYCLAACGEALQAVPELTDGAPRFGVLLAGADGELRSLLVAAPQDAPLDSADDRLRAIDAALRSNADADLTEANLWIHDYGASGSLLATPTPIGAGHVGSVGIGRVRRQIVVRTTDGADALYVAALCHVSLSFLPDRLALHRAHRFLGRVVSVLEQWPI